MFYFLNKVTKAMRAAKVFLAENELDEESMNRKKGGGTAPKRLQFGLFSFIEPAKFECKTIIYIYK